MVKLSILVAICMVAFVAGHSGEHKRNKRGTIEIITNANVLDWLCQNNAWGFNPPWCSATTASPQTSTTPSTGTTQSGTSTTVSDTTTSPTLLQSVYWCQLANKTTLTLGQTYLQTACMLCQCTTSKAVVCNTLQCMPTQCIDGSTPTVKSGQCCSTCAYETNANSCTQNGVTFPHGTIVKTNGTNVLCWCQSGTIECRKAVTTVTTTTWEYFSNTSSAYIAIIVICLVLMFGTILCCGCGLLYYYYYQQQQQSVQQAYEQYYNNAGWQPMGEDGQVIDAAAKEREATGEQNETEHNYPTGYAGEFVPPPYAVYTGPYGSDAGKGQKHV